MDFAKNFNKKCKLWYLFMEILVSVTICLEYDISTAKSSLTIYLQDITKSVWISVIKCFFKPGEWKAFQYDERYIYVSFILALIIH